MDHQEPVDSQSKLKKPRKRRLTRAERLAKRIADSLAGGESGSVAIKTTLSGAAAETWRSLRAAAEGLHATDADLIAALEVEAAVTVRNALIQIPRKV